MAASDPLKAGLPYAPGYVALTPAQASTHRAEYRKDPDLYIVRGPCPRCGHVTTDDAVTSWVLLPEAEVAPATSPGLAPAPTEPPAPRPSLRSFMRICDCDYLHLDAEDKPHRGCGARWAAGVEEAVPYQVDAPDGDPPLTTTDQDAADVAVDGALTQARGNAEKWRNALAGFTGLVGTFLLLGGVTEFAKSTFAPAIVLFGLAGLVCGAIATYLAAEAAIGRPVEFQTRGHGDAAEMKVVRMQQARFALERLETAKVFALAAGTFLVLATLASYLPTAAKAPQLSITLQDAQAPVCGTPTKGQGDVIVIATADGRRIDVPTSNIKTIDIVDGCP